MACCSIRFVLFLLLALLGVGLSAAFVPLRPTPVVVSARPAAIIRRRSSTTARNVLNAVPTSSRTSTTLEREATTLRPNGPSVLERPAIERLRHDHEVERVPSKQERHGQGSEAWEVRIYNDGLNTREHVARSLVQVTGLSELQAYQTLMQAHQNGMAAVGRWVYEVAEMYHDALKKKGIVCDIIPVEEE